MRAEIEKCITQVRQFRFFISFISLISLISLDSSSVTLLKVLRSVAVSNSKQKINVNEHHIIHRAMLKIVTTLTTVPPDFNPKYLLNLPLQLPSIAMS